MTMHDLLPYVGIIGGPSTLGGEGLVGEVKSFLPHRAGDALWSRFSNFRWYFVHQGWSSLAPESHFRIEGFCDMLLR